MVGAPLDLRDIEYRPSRLQLFRFSAVTWNAHRIHYDEAYARCMSRSLRAMKVLRLR